MQYLKSIQDVQNPTEHIRFIQNSSKNSYRDRGFLLWKRRGKTEEGKEETSGSPAAAGRGNCYPGSNP